MVIQSSYLFSSESVSEGHPDKVSDQISDALLDAALSQDPLSRVAIETFVTANTVIIGGEVATQAKLAVDDIVRSVIRDIGYTEEGSGFAADTVRITNLIAPQSQDIAMGVSAQTNLFGVQGAGDQGIMFGYATNETPEYLPAPLTYAHKILKRAALLRKNGTLPFLRPDAKSQISIRYDNHKPVRIDSVVLSHQHSPDITREELEHVFLEDLVRPVLEGTNLLDGDTKYYFNPTGRFVLGGPAADTGLTGRKIIVDTYGGAGRHGGGAFSGKDPSKVDRSASYYARYVAKNIVATGLASRLELQVAYAIGVPFPVSIYVNTFGTGKKSDREIEKIITEKFNFSPASIIAQLDLLRPIYRHYDTYGHFSHPEAPWEQVGQVDL
ncbi:methionine adenosyltransferase [Parasphaerochaeta coccoides]|uniref:S-adenosylmethionine synthase n=1 Tax=Parasphaerochaeta coccoides (strain ATCC BAA-1237 / DSM 17374 / SPN1) TaxID=760011 RepID=F4GIA7_PARC1|nr:methionine adenosyltransferase [Parasphaerochaeta coccoides]AEC01266.1 methionine adenosyltransferase [Parasphaerochaeta coccoides DSM 17374]